jgi:twinkle protein
MTQGINGKVSIYKDFNDLQGHTISVLGALERIRTGKSKALVEKAREAKTKKEADELKKKLPAVCFSGTFSKRKDSELLEHSGYIVLDFDNVSDMAQKRSELCSVRYITAVWESPSGKGLKALVQIEWKTKHKEHFDALMEEMPDIDKTGRNVSRLCFESYDTNLWYNENAEVYTKLPVKKEDRRLPQQTTTETINDDDKIFQNLLTWMTSKGDAFREGERNHFVFKLAASCCRFGMMEETCYSLMMMHVTPNSSFSQKECRQAIRSAYRSNMNQWNTAEFTKDQLVTKSNHKEVEIVITAEDAENIAAEDVIYAEEVFEQASEIYHKGYQAAMPLGVPLLDKHFKRVKGELTIVSGIGNYGKSSFMKWEMIFRMVKFGEKVAIFTPEELPAEQFYHDLVEIYFGKDCTPNNYHRPSYESYKKVYDMIGQHIFMVYPKNVSPTPDYVKEVFLSMIIKHGIDRVVIDPFNQMANDYSKGGGRSDKYLETFLSDCTRFARKNNVYFDIVVHPHKMRKGDDGNYPCPEVFDLADGAMWNNKADNIIIYHRPLAQTAPESPLCEFHSKKIRRQKIVGIKGFFDFELVRSTRRFTFEGVDYLQQAIDGKYVQAEIQQPKPSVIKPNKSWTDSKETKEWNEEPGHPNGYKEAWE